MPFHPVLGLGALALGLLALASKPKLYRVSIDTYESGDYPILTHTFRGNDRAQAWHYVEAHMKTDRFFAGCARGRFADFDCHNVVSHDGWE